jgi:hypothetical protein
VHEPGAQARDAAAGRAEVTRAFDVYREGRLVLTVRDEPGTLRSTAPPPPGPKPGPPGPPGSGPAPGSHPFLDGQAHDAVSEDQLGRLLAESDSFDGYLRALLDAGYDIAAEGSGRELPGLVRLHDGEGLAGAAWPVGGRYASLARGADGAYEFATATAYAERAEVAILAALSAATTFEAFEAQLERAGLL